MENQKVIIETLQKAGKPLKSGEIAELSGIDKKEVDKLIKKLKTEGQVHSPKMCYYEIKK
jgi:DNA-binding IscR family transcriptional regulator